MPLFVSVPYCLQTLLRTPPPQSSTAVPTPRLPVPVAYANLHFVDVHQYNLTNKFNKTIWSSDCSSHSILGLGTSAGMCMLSLPTQQWCPGSLREQKDMLAVRWSSTHVLLGGTREGTVWHSDQRVPVTERLLRHPSPVTGLGMLDDFRVVVAGMNNQVRQEGIH